MLIEILAYSSPQMTNILFWGVIVINLEYKKWMGTFWDLIAAFSSCLFIKPTLRIECFLKTLRGKKEGRSSEGGKEERTEVCLS